MKKFECSCLLNIWLLVELEEADEDEALDTLLNMPLKDLLKEKIESFDIADWTLKEIDGDEYTEEDYKMDEADRKLKMEREE